MDSIEFLAIILVFAGILSWYIHNVRTGANGHAGLFALMRGPVTENPEQPHSQYRAKACAGEKIADPSDRAAAGGGCGTQSRRKFRRLEKARYQVKDKAARYGSPKEKAPF